MLTGQTSKAKAHGRSGALDADSGENSGELDTGEPDTAEKDKESPSTAQHKVLLGPKDYKRLKHGKDAPFDAELQCLKPQLLAQALASFIYLFIYLLSLFSPKKEKRGSFKRKKAQKNPRARVPPGRGLRWGLVCFAEILLVFEDSLEPAPPVWTA